MAEGTRAEETPADLFLDLWLALAEDDALAETVCRIEADPVWSRSASSDLDAILARPGRDLVPTLHDWQETCGLDPTAAALLLAQAVDRWHEPLRLDQDVHRMVPEDLRRAGQRLRREHALNRDRTRGSVILRRPSWGRWQDPATPEPTEQVHLAHLFDSLTVLPPTIQASDPDDPSVARTIALEYRVASVVTRREVPDGSLVIGLAPIAEQEADLPLQVLTAGPVPWYDANPAATLGGRAAKVVEELCTAGAHVIVFPEMVFTSDSLAEVQQAVARHGPDSELRFVLAGTHRRDTGDTPPVNEAVLFDHRGDEVLRQAKLHRWNMKAGASARYGLGTHSLLKEHITPGDRVTVVEYPLFGRLLVMVCEDLSRSEPGRWLRSNLLLDWIFTPIMDSSISVERWMCLCGQEAARQGRCRVVVANSLPLSRVQARLAGTAIPDAGIGVCIDFDGYDQLRYSLIADPGPSVSPRRHVVHWRPGEWPALAEHVNIDVN